MTGERTMAAEVDPSARPYQDASVPRSGDDAPKKAPPDAALWVSRSRQPCCKRQQGCEPKTTSVQTAAEVVVRPQPY